jgi:hypothetical protein
MEEVRWFTCRLRKRCRGGWLWPLEKVLHDPEGVCHCRHGMVCRLVRVFKSIVKYRWKNRLSKKYLV